MAEILIEYLRQFITDRKWDLFKKIIDQRTRYITVVLEDIYQAQNASAVLRTSDCFGIQDVHIIENTNEFKINPDVELGAAQWLNISNYNSLENNTLATIRHLRNIGYRIIATTPHTNDVELENFDLNKGKIALFFGSEQPGLSEIMMNNADEFLKIPMYGFTESFNISVSASIILHQLVEKLKKSSINWQLNNEEKNEVILNWLKYSIKESEKIIKEYYRRNRPA
jgi:tRNA (guanosine-2'-O-)-methyltransferase